MTRILVTGANGYIGNHLLYPLSRGERVVVKAVSRNAVGLERERVELVTMDVGRQGWTEALEEPVDTVIHLAQSSRYREFPDGAADMVRVNIDATLELLAVE